MTTKEAAQSAAVTFDDVSVTIGANEILYKIKASIPQGSCTAIVGPNGAGKTTLIMALLSQISYQGNITTCNYGNPSKLSIGYVPQKLDFDRGMPLTVLEFMSMGKQRLPFWFGVRRKYRDEAMELLKTVHAEKLAKRRIGALSGGELQRVLLALALEQQPELLVLDEATAGVDIHGERLFCGLLDDLRKKFAFTQLMVNHDLSIVTHHATHVICLNHTVIAEGSPGEVLTPRTLTQLFGVHMGLVSKNGISTANAYCTGACCTRKTE